MINLLAGLLIAYLVQALPVEPIQGPNGRLIPVKECHYVIPTESSYATAYKIIPADMACQDLLPVTREEYEILIRQGYTEPEAPDEETLGTPL